MRRIVNGGQCWKHTELGESCGEYRMTYRLVVIRLAVRICEVNKYVFQNFVIFLNRTTISNFSDFRFRRKKKHRQMITYRKPEISMSIPVICTGTLYSTLQHEQDMSH